MIVYEVRATLDAAIAADYRAWLDGHAREILQLPGFDRAELLQEEKTPDHAIWVIRYHLESRAALENYLKEHAPRLRAEGTARFGERVSLSRRVLELMQQFS